jgi:phage FluMu gp28-like protein
MLQWQRDWLADESRFKLGVASRQSGKSHVGALEDVIGAVAKKSLSVILSAGERQSLEVMEKVRMHTKALGAAIDVEDAFFKDTSLLQHTANYPNGSRIIALPANPDTARGYSGNVRLDEFGVHKDSRAIWAALVPTITRGYKLRVTSTFKGTENKFYELGKMLGLSDGCPDILPARANGWSGHWVDIHLVAEQARQCPELGLKIDPEELRRAIDDEEVWLQEFCNIPMSGAEQFLATDLVLACESEEASAEWDGEPLPGLCAGMDIGRVHDRTVIIPVAPVADLAIVRGIITMERTPFADQRKRAREVAAVVQAAGGRFCVDATGIGAQLAEELRGEFSCVEAVQFAARVESGAKDAKGETISVGVKERMAVGVKRRMEDHTLRLPESPRLRRACSAIKRIQGATGQMRFDAARTDQGHADEFWALALALAGMETARSYTPASAGGLMGRPVMSGLMERVF